MDDALQQAYRQALTEPDDPAARRAYAHALVRAGHRDGAALLRDVPPCSTCAGEPDLPPGAQRCAACDGLGELVEFTGRAEDRLPCDRCDATGAEVCPDCDGAALADLDPPTTPGPCACGKAPALEHAAPTWTPPDGLARGVWLARCPACGLPALRRRQHGDWRHGCQGCLQLVCVCG